MLLDMLGLLARWFLLSAKYPYFILLIYICYFFFFFFFLSFFGHVCSYRILEIINQFLKLEQKMAISGILHSVRVIKHRKIYIC
jgi:hypothetical protein